MRRLVFSTLLQGTKYKLYSLNIGAYTINEVEIQLLINDRPQFWVVSPDNLKIVPRIGETIFIPTLTRDHIGASYFRVHEIIHDISEGKHVIEIHASN